MGGSGRKRNSKWDLKEESRASFDSVQGSTWYGKTGSSVHDKESQRGWVSPEAAGSNRSKWSAVDSFPGRRGSRRDDSIDEDRNRSSKPMTTLEGNEGYGTRMSPGLEEWRHQSSHQSPKNEWKRSRRSRSRSRSPVHNFRHESGAYDRSTSRSGFSAQPCKDFPSGRCRRGSHCQFLHQGGQSYDDDWERQRKPVASKYSIPNDSEKTSHEVIRERDDRRHRYASPERGGERELRRASDIPCKFFSAGNCRNGKYCKFSHNSQTNVSPEKRPRDGRWSAAEKSDAVEKSWNGPGWSDSNTSSDALLSRDTNDKLQNNERSHTAWSVDDDWGHSLGRNRTHSDLPISKTVESDKREPLQWKTENSGDNVHVPEKRVAENWPGNMDMSPDWNYSIQPSNHTGKGGHATFPSSEPGIPLEVSGQVRDTIATMPRVVNDIQEGHKLMEVGASSFSHNDNVAIGTSASTHVNLSASDLATQSFNQHSIGSNALTLPNLNVVGLRQETTLADPSRGEIIVNPQNPMLFPEKKTNSQLHNVDSNVPQVSSLIPSTQNTVSGEQFNHLTNIQASLAQLLANGQQLPQLYAAHNSHNGGNAPVSANPEGPAGSNAAVSIQPDQLVGSHKQYDPICDSVEPEKLAHPSGSRPNLIEQRTADSILQMPNKDASHPSSSGAINGGRYNKFLSLEEESGDKSFQSSNLGPGANPEATKENPNVETLGSRKELEESKTAQENGPSENIDGDGKGDESKKSKDAKGIRAFKFSLVEVVKDLLKPAWKEGQIKKDAYKNIVKKVVDKVTSTMQSTSIPQTQEKIDQYLSFSKPKLTKLVQAYVEKFQKDK